ncbi:MAG TPA: hypothetical protein VD866_17760 [Urbifossiella sp.]|nr:hypothetical protein [Urbifossiella sp.]
MIAVTQESINQTALHFLNTQQPEVVACYVADSTGAPVPIDPALLHTQTGGVDPFSIPAGTNPAVDDRLRALTKARFVFGVKAVMGIPPVDDPSSLPDIVGLGADASACTFQLLCKEFVLVHMNPAAPGPATLQRVEQPHNNPWVFKYQCRLSPQQTAGADYIKSARFADLPEALKQRLNAHPKDFTINELVADFTAATVTPPTISNVDAGLIKVLNKDFGQTYYNQMKLAGRPVIAVTPSAGGPDERWVAEYSVQPLLNGDGSDIPHPDHDQQRLATLNYLCVAGGPVPQAPPRFPWNWVGDRATQGVCAFNRNSLAKFFRSRLDDHVASNCWFPHPVLSITTAFTAQRAFRLVAKNRWGALVPSNPPDSTYQVVCPPTGRDLVTWDFTCYVPNDEWCGNFLEVTSTFKMSVTVDGANTVFIRQRNTIYVYMRMMGFVRRYGNFVDIETTEELTLGVTADGNLSVTGTHEQKNYSVDPNYWASAVYHVDLPKYADVANQVVATGLTDVPVAGLRDVVFPGGKAFSFSKVAFTDHYDLLAHITYRNVD